MRAPRHSTQDPAAGVLFAAADCGSIGGTANRATGAGARFQCCTNLSELLPRA
jgi:hypothetical protein